MADNGAIIFNHPSTNRAPRPVDINVQNILQPKGNPNAGGPQRARDFSSLAGKPASRGRVGDTNPRRRPNNSSMSRSY